MFRQQETITWGVVWAVLSLGDVAFALGDAAQALEYFQEALALSQEDISSNAWVLINLGRATHALGDDIQAQTYYTESLAAFRELGDRVGVASVFLDLGRVAHTQGDDRKAREYYTQSLTVFGEFKNKQLISECLEGIAGLASAAGQHPEGTRRAARLFGAAESVRESAGVPLPSVQRAEYKRTIAAIRAQIEEPTFAAAWAEGQKLTLEQAIAEALAGSPINDGASLDAKESSM